MKKHQLIILAISLFAITSCYRGRHQTTIIETSTNGVSTKVQYAGRVVFDSTKTAVESMSPGAYLKYKNSNGELSAECDKKGIIFYTVDDDAKTTQLNNQGKKLMAEAVKMLSDNDAKRKGKL